MRRVPAGGRDGRTSDDSGLTQAISILAHAQQDAVRHRNRIANEWRSLLREFHPGFLAAFVNRTVGLAARRSSPSHQLRLPAAGPTLDIDKISAVLRSVGRKRGITSDAEAITAALHAFPAPPTPTDAANQHLVG